MGSGRSPGGCPTRGVAGLVAELLRELLRQTPLEQALGQLGENPVRSSNSRPPASTFGMTASMTSSGTAACGSTGGGLSESVWPQPGPHFEPPWPAPSDPASVHRGRVPMGWAGQFGEPTRSPATPWSRPSRCPAASTAATGSPASGDRQLNPALHLVTVTQVRMRGSARRRYCDWKIAEGKTRNEPMRCLKRRIASHVWHIMLAEETRRQQNLQERPAAA